MDNKNNDPGINLKNYEKTGGGSLKKVNIGLWILKNRRNFFIFLILILGAGSIIVYSYFFYNLYDYIRYGSEEKKSLEELSNVNVNLNPGRLATAIEEGSPQSFFHNNQYDFVVKVKNPNNNFFANINYCFFDGDKQLACSGSTIFPETAKHLIVLSTKLESRPINLRFVIRSSNWERVDIRKFPDWKGYYSERINFLVSDTKFESLAPIELSSKSINNISFSIKNNTPYNYREVPLNIILSSRGSIVGVNKYTVTNFMSMEEKRVELSWSNSLSTVDTIEVIPDLNILNEDNYIKYK